MKKLIIIILLLWASAAMAAGNLFPWNLRVGSSWNLDKPNVEYTGKAYPVPADATSSYARLLDKGKKPLDNATLYSGQQLEGDGVDAHVDIGDISASCKSLEITIDPATKTEGIIQLASGVSISISSGTISTAGLTNVMAYVNGTTGTTVAAELTVLALTFDAVSCDDVQLFFNGTDYFNGVQGNVKLWAETLDSDDVVFSYAHPESPAYNRPGTSLTAANLKGWWPLIAGSGDTAYDWSGNGNHGTMNDFPTDDSQWITRLSNPRIMQTAFMGFGMGSNELASNQDFDSWGDSNSIRSASAGLNPEGANVSIYTLTPQNLGDAGDRLSINIGTLSARQRYFSVWVKPASEEQTVKLRLYSPSSGNVEEEFLTSGLTWQLVELDKSFVPTGSEAVTAYIYPDRNSLNTCDIWNPQISAESLGATVFPSAATNALVPLRDWETHGQFTRDNNELNWNGRSYANCGNGVDVNPSTAVIIEGVFGAPPAGEYYICNKYGSYGIRRVNGYFNPYIIQASGIVSFSVAQTTSNTPRHFIMVFGGDALTLYVNGVLVGVNPAVVGENLAESNYTLIVAGIFEALPTPATGQLPLFRMITDADAQKIIDKGLDAWVAKRYAKVQAKYNIALYWGAPKTAYWDIARTAYWNEARNMEAEIK